MFLIYENDNHFNIGYYNKFSKILNKEKVSSNIHLKEIKNVYKKDINNEEKEFHLKDLNEMSLNQI